MSDNTRPLASVADSKVQDDAGRWLETLSLEELIAATFLQPIDLTPQTFYCSFCGKSHHEVRKIIAGPTCFICNECTEISYDLCNPK
jgi:hypothetical protein